MAPLIMTPIFVTEPCVVIGRIKNPHARKPPVLIIPILKRLLVKPDMLKNLVPIHVSAQGISVKKRFALRQKTVRGII